MTWCTGNSLPSGPPQSTRRLLSLPRRSRTHPKTHRHRRPHLPVPIEKELEILTIGQGLIVL
jgi:hypothetical protein